MIDRGTCYHESGHAVVAHVLGLSVEEISVNEDDYERGHMAGLPIEGEAVARAAVFRSDPEFVHRYLLSIAAGPVGKCLYMRGVLRSSPWPWELFGGEHDRFAAERLIGAAGLDTDLDDVVEEAIDYLRDSRVWAAIERVVAELHHFNGQLDHELFIGAYMGLVPLR